MKTIKLMPDYQCWPLWWAEKDQVGNIDPKQLPLSISTQQALLRWADTYDKSLNMEDPASSPPWTAEESANFEKEGLRLWRVLRKELKDNYRVLYFSQLTHQLEYPKDS